MTTYVIGDLQGCLDPLKLLLDKIRFNPSNDKLWFVGDLVNRGPKSLQTLRFVKALGDNAVCVLGNHDLHLLAVVHGFRKSSGKDTLKRIVNAPDRDELCAWLASRPLLHHDEALAHTLVHAGIYPHWSMKQACKQAKRLHKALTKNLPDTLLHMYGNAPVYWDKHAEKHERNRFAINVFTRMRYCRLDGALDFDFNGAPASAPKHLRPWYALADRKPLNTRIVFGHWSSHPGIGPSDVVPTDRGCVWGGCLSAYAIETNTTTYVRCE